MLAFTNVKQEKEMREYCSYNYRTGKQELNGTEKELMEILMEFGKSIDHHGYDGGDYTTAIRKLIDVVLHGFSEI